ncbi:hypothetical protein ACIPWY_31360 [Streptomyces sp. NPDC090032]|uniref:hypothetical protein n=1 Tax=unclassified Streptomyces TaxID=2593676 RepID=UPI003712D9E7
MQDTAEDGEAAVLVHRGLVLLDHVGRQAEPPPRLPATWAMTLLVVLHAALTLAWMRSYVFLLSKGERTLEKPRIRRAPGRTTGVVLIGFGLAVATASV